MDEYLSRASLRVLVVGLVAMAAVAVGAAAVTSAVEPGSPDGQPGGEPSQPGDDGSVAPSTPSDPGEEPSPPSDTTDPRDPIDASWCVQPLSAWYGGVVYFGAFAAALAAIKRRYSVGATFFGLYALAPPAFLTYFLSTDCPTYDGPGLGPGPDLSGSGDGGLTEPLIHAVNVPPEAVLGVFGAVLVGTAAVLLRASGGETVTDVSREPASADDGDPVDPRDLAVAAGRAADRLEDRNADADNEVYRAWWEMTSLLDVADPDTATPGEFADAAVDIGLSEGDVTELTRLFEEVRYGERDAASREELAVSVFRAIEESYGEDAATDADSDSRDDVEGGDGAADDR